MRIKTERLELVAGNLELSEAEINDLNEFSRLLNAQVTDWPPPLNDENSMRSARDYFAQNPDANGWGLWYFILRSENEQEHILIGGGGFKGRPSPDGTVEIGYSLLERFHKQG
ncbi:GNAT family N-acetyltransferase [Candidatus Acetothermia bacterium]|nr:GNAT family N-acetyltransferase [Candidatus Acetothermia bacterium]MBI3659950.1 GNAT family N-acetyltransferase [Candidatus Acetothermia bacterium]